MKLYFKKYFKKLYFLVRIFLGKQVDSKIYFFLFNFKRTLIKFLFTIFKALFLNICSYLIRPTIKNDRSSEQIIFDYRYEDCYGKSIL